MKARTITMWNGIERLAQAQAATDARRMMVEAVRTCGNGARGSAPLPERAALVGERNRALAEIGRLTKRIAELEAELALARLCNEVYETQVADLIGGEIP